MSKNLPLRLPKPVDCPDWLILGLDPSLSRTGYAALEVHSVDGGADEAEWRCAGSIKPNDTKDPIWIRAKMMALYLRQKLETESYGSHTGRPMGLIISLEAPTPGEDRLVAVQRILQLVLFEDSRDVHGMSMYQRFSSVHVLMTNASTLRSLMALTKKGTKNKAENIERAYEYIDRQTYPELDSDACDAVMLAMMGRYTASIMMGKQNNVPERFLNRLCDCSTRIKGKGRNARTITEGLLWRPEYWYEYTRQDYTLCVKDASSPSKRLAKQTYNL